MAFRKIISGYRETLRRSMTSPYLVSNKCVCRLLRQTSIRPFAHHSQNAASGIGNRLHRAYNVFQDNFTLISVLFGRQVKGLVSLRIRRTMQMKHLMEGLGHDCRDIAMRSAGAGARLLNSVRAGGLMSAAAIFSWKNGRIEDKEIRRVGNQFKDISHSEGEGRVMNDPQYPNEWEKILDEERVTIWRRPISDSLYEYKLFGTFSDISARSFYCSQTDFNFRKSWDKLIVKLEVVEKDPVSGTEIVQWITKFPYPYYRREYIYAKKAKVDRKKNLLVIIGRAAEHPSCPVEENKQVRVDTYESTFVLRPHTTIDANGFDYLLTYRDDPKCTLPSVCYDWVAKKGVPDYLNKLHDNAVKYTEYIKTNPADYSDIGMAKGMI